nr:unnamed protein product [Naegleria fowleri]
MSPNISVISNHSARTTATTTTTTHNNVTDGMITSQIASSHPNVTDLIDCHHPYHQHEPSSAQVLLASHFFTDDNYSPLLVQTTTTSFPSTTTTTKTKHHSTSSACSSCINSNINNTPTNQNNNNNNNTNNNLYRNISCSTPIAPTQTAGTVTPPQCLIPQECSNNTLSESVIQQRVRFIKDKMLLLVNFEGLTLRSVHDVNTIQQVLQELVGSHMKNILQSAQQSRKDKYGKLYSSNALRLQQQYQIDCFVCYENFSCDNEDLWIRFQHTMESLQQQFNFRMFEEFSCKNSYEARISQTMSILSEQDHVPAVFSRSLSPPRSSYMNSLEKDHNDSPSNTSISPLELTKPFSQDVISDHLDSALNSITKQPIKHVIQYHAKYFTSTTTSSSHQMDDSKSPSSEIYITINNRFELYKVLSRGTYGTVYKGQDNLHNTSVAVKELDLEMMDKIGAIEFAQREVEIMKLIKDHPHPHIVNTLDVIEEYETIVLSCNNKPPSKSFVYIVTEFCEKGSLENPLDEHEQHKEEDVQRYYVQMVLAIEHMHNVLSILHRDITLSNVCLDVNGNVKIVDFGLSDKFEKGKKYHRLFVGNGGYCCPEVLLKKCYAEEIDVYALGVVLYKLLTGYLPFRTAQDKFSMNYFIPLEEEEQISDTAKNVIQNLLEINLAKRWKLEDVKQDIWFKEGLQKLQSGSKQ